MEKKVLPSSEPDISKLYKFLADSEKKQQVGNDIIKALVIDILRSKLAFPTDRPVNWLRNIDPIPSWRRIGPGPDPESSVWVRAMDPIIHWRNRGTGSIIADSSEVAKTIQKLLAEVKLSDEEKRIADELDLL